VAGEPRRPERPLDDDILSLPSVFRLQASACRDLGSALSATLLDYAANDIDQSGHSAEIFRRWPEARFGDLLGLRALATAHRLVLQRRAPNLAIHYPSVGGLAPKPGDSVLVGPAFVEALAANTDDLVRGMADVPQTNESGRVAPLRQVLASIDAATPVHLREFGASAGLNLLVDRIDPSGDGLALPPIASRRGCDRHPVDISTTEGRLRLTSFVWPDDLARLERLRRALQEARVVPPEVVAQDAADFVLDCRLQPESALVIWHSAVWFYLDKASRDSIVDSIDRLGSQATERSPLLHASWEWRGVESTSSPGSFALVVRRWAGTLNDGVPMLWGTGPAHGVPFAASVPAPL